MIKAFFRFSLLLILCVMLVYAPEILSSVSAPYALSSPERILLRVAIHGDTSMLNTLHAAIQSYQKEYPRIHMRITHIGENLFLDSSPPYPDVVCCPAAIADRLPSSFTRVMSSCAGDQLCAVNSVSNQAQAAAELTAYIYEALSAQSGSAEI